MIRISFHPISRVGYQYGGIVFIISYILYILKKSNKHDSSYLSMLRLLAKDGRIDRSWPHRQGC